MGTTRTVRTATTNRGGVSRQHDTSCVGWTVLYQSPSTGEVVLLSVRYDSKRSVRQLLEEQGVDIAEAIVELVR